LNAPNDWWNTFFSGLAVEMWRGAMPPEATQADIDFLWKHLKLAPGARVLDVPCGAGRLALPLAERGCAVTGVDISQEFLDAAAEAAAEKGLSRAIALRRGDMRDLPAGAGFDAAFCFGNSFGYLDDRGNEAFLDAIAAALGKGGRFAIDFGQTAEGVLPALAPRQQAYLGNIHFEEETRFDARTSRIENVFTFSRGEQSETKLASQRLYLAGDVARMLERAGFEICGFYGSPAQEPFALKSQRLLIVGEKR
jgi:SAM-dependent methyltransferase